MQTRLFGRSGLKLSVFGFGCGAIGGLMVRGDAAEQDATFARALEVGINYFDTAAQYGNGESERNLGRLIRARKPQGIVVGTKVKVDPAATDVAQFVAASLDASLDRLELPDVDILHLHNAITDDGRADTLSAERVLQDVIPAFEKLRGQGKIRFIGVTAVGDSPAIRRVIASGRVDSAQVVVNLLNPTAFAGVPPDYPGLNYHRLFASAESAGVGTIGIRVMAGGALSGTLIRHPNAGNAPRPIGSARTFETDVARAGQFAALIGDGAAKDMAELATRFAISHEGLCTALVGLATKGEFEAALTAIEKGPLPPDVLARISTIQATFAGQVG